MIGLLLVSKVGRHGMSSTSPKQVIPAAQSSDYTARLLGDKTFANRVSDEICAVVKVELLHDVAPMGIDGIHTQYERISDLLTRRSLSD
jgi:hypothetical protein